MELEHIISDNNIHIIDSYKVRKRKEMKDFLLSIKCNNAVFNNRSIYSLISEWRAHNLCYDLHLFRSHTKDVDLNYPQKWYMKYIYSIMSLFYIGI